MKNKSVRDEAKLYFIPFLLGDSRRSRALSARIFRKFGVSCLILDKKRSLLDLFDLSSCFYKLFSDDSALLCEQLIPLATAEPYTLPLLIPTDERYELAVSEQRELLEKYFIILDAGQVFTDSPMARIL